VGYTDIYGQPFAQKLVEDTSTGTHLLLNTSNVTTVSGTPHTLSVYAKAAERAWFQLGEGQSVTASAYFDLATGAVGTVAGTGSPSASIQSIGNGWYLCSLTFIAGSVSRMRLYTATGNGGAIYTGDGTSGIFIFGAQLSDSASVDPYVYQPVAAPTSTAYYGPRFDYDPVTLAPKGLLIEEQRTNLLLQSENLGTTWTTAAASIAPNSIVSPSGELAAEKLTPDTASTTHFVGQTVTTTAVAHTYSAYLKAGGYSWAILYASGANQGAYFDLVNGVVGSSFVGAPTSSSITPVGNGWYRCSITFTATTSTIARVYANPANATSTFAGDGVSGIYIWGAQLEAGAFATSYIPTGASQVTRAADNASMIGNNFARWYNQTEGTLFTEAIAVSGGQQAILVLDSANSIQIYQSSTTQAGGFVRLSAAFQASMLANAAQNTNAKLAIGYKTNDCAFVGNGGTPVTDTSVSLPIPTTLRIGAGSTGAADFINGTIKRLAYYPRRLANTELQGITS
jgi:hypothetical protein